MHKAVNGTQDRSAAPRGRARGRAANSESERDNESRNRANSTRWGVQIRVQKAQAGPGAKRRADNNTGS